MLLVWLGSLCQTCNPEVTQEAQVRLRTGTLQGNDLRQVVHTHASVTKQYNLVPASPMGCKQAHRAIHWPCIRDLTV